MTTRDFIEKLSELGYPEADKLTPDALDWAFESPAMKEFLEWFCSTYDERNKLSEEELAEFRELEESGVEIMDNKKLEDALKHFPQLEDEVDEELLKEKIKNSNEELNILHKRIALDESTNAKLRIHLENVRQQDSQMSVIIASTRKTLQETYELCEDAVEEYKQELQNLLQKETDFIEAICSESSRELDSRLYSSVPLTEFHLGEEMFNQELKRFIEKQFPEEMETLSGENDTTSYLLLRVDDPDVTLISGRKREEYLRNLQKLHQLHEMYVPSQKDLVKAEMENCRIEAELNKAQEIYNNITADKIPRSVCILRGATEDMKQTFKVLENQAKNIVNKEIHQIVCELANMEVTEVIIGDFNLKLARQNYFISKQEEVLQFLISQNARGEILSLLFEHELEKLQSFHSFTRVMKTFIFSHSMNIEKMQEVLENLKDKKMAIKEVENRFRNTFLNILEVCIEEPSRTLMSFIQDSLMTETKNSADLDERLTDLSSLQKEIYSLENAVSNDPLYTVKNPTKCTRTVNVEILKGLKPIAKLAMEAKDIVSEFKKEVLMLMKSHSEKQNIIEKKPEVRTEYRFLTLFYNNPEQLKTEIEKLEETSKIGHRKRKN